ncbi:MAG: hypothetical protein IMZ58_07335 [Thermoplasmata archaeon]|nr:hypothetical protein [Thermoplasmata archaeon]
MIDDYEEFVGKNVTLVKRNGFVLDGKVLKADVNGIMFETWKMISYFSWSEIGSLVPKVN